MSTTTGFDINCSFIPFMKDGICGYVVTRKDTGEQSFLIFNPSLSGGGDLPDVFIYRSPTFDPADGSPLCFVTAFDPGEA